MKTPNKKFQRCCLRIAHAGPHMFIDTSNPAPMAGECQARPAAHAFQITTYQDQDPLGRGQWFAYASQDGHVRENFGGYATRDQAQAEAEEWATLAEHHITADDEGAAGIIYTVRLPQDCGEVSYRSDSVADALWFVVERAS